MKGSDYKNFLLRVKLVVGIYDVTKDPIKSCHDADTIWHWIVTGKDPIVDKSN